MRSVYDSIKSVVSLVPVVLTANTNGIVVDTKGYNSAKIAIAVGDLTTVDETYTFKVQEGDETDLSDATDVSGATAAVTADSEVANIRVEGLGTSVKRYIRVVLTVAGSNPSCPCSAMAELGNAFRKPVN